MDTIHGTLHHPIHGTVHPWSMGRFTIHGKAPKALDLSACIRGLRLSLTPPVLLKKELVRRHDESWSALWGPHPWHRKWRLLHPSEHKNVQRRCIYCICIYSQTLDMEMAENIKPFWQRATNSLRHIFSYHIKWILPWFWGSKVQRHTRSIWGPGDFLSMPNIPTQTRWSGSVCGIFRSVCINDDLRRSTLWTKKKAPHSLSPANDALKGSANHAHEHGSQMPLLWRAKKTQALVCQAPA